MPRVILVMTRYSSLLVFLVACSSNDAGRVGVGVDGGGSGSGSDHVACTYPPTDGKMSCGELKNAKSQQVSDFTTECHSVNGTVSELCPPANLVGCCATVIPNFGTQVGCSYSGDATDLGSACTEQGGTFSTTP